MDGSRGYDTKRDKSDRKTDTMWFHVHVNSKEQSQRTNKQNKSRLVGVENKVVIAGWVGEGWVKKIKKYKAAVTK